MKLVTTEQIRVMERKLIQNGTIPGDELMERAGLGVADAVINLADMAGFHHPTIALVAGRGNNGGDAFATARFLKTEGFDVEVWLAAAANEIRGDALKHLSRMRAAGVDLLELPTMEDWDAGPPTDRVDLIVDGILGVGIQGPARGPAAAAVHMVNMLAHRSLVVAIDVPSGMDADSGETRGEAVSADLTVTIGLPKIGLVLPPAIDHVGAIDMVDIGLPIDDIRRLACDMELITAADICDLLPPRHRQSHKGSFGHLLLVGGSDGMAGSIILAAQAAVRSGCGLVSAAVPRCIAATVAGAVPEAMVHGVKHNDDGSIDHTAAERIATLSSKCNAMALGPGMTTHPATRPLLEKILTDFNDAAVLDADAINAFAGETNVLKTFAAKLVLTPHPGELARLTGRDIAAIQKNRRQITAQTANDTGAVVVLKGAGTVIAAPESTPHINMTGNPGMATGGMGDVLTGLLGGLLAQGMPPFNAARAAVWLHGRAGDQAAWRTSQAGLHAGALIEEIPHVYRAVSVR